MVDLIVEPRLQSLGMQGEYFFVKVQFPIISLQDGADPVIAAHRGLVLKMKVEDLPAFTEGMEFIHFDVGRAWKDYSEENDRSSNWVNDFLSDMSDGRAVVTNLPELDVVVDNLMECKKSDFLTERRAQSLLGCGLKDIIQTLDSWLQASEPDGKRVCPGCHVPKKFDPNTWHNISETGGVTYGCEDCSKRRKSRGAETKDR